MRYDDVGTGIPVLFVHGFPLDHAMWRPQVAALRDGFRCIVPDLPGLGSSPLAEDPATMDGFARDLVTLLDRLGLQQAVVCGFSMGGYVALAFQEHHPERVKGLILCSTRAADDTSDARRARAATAQSALDQGMAALAPDMASGLLSERTRLERKGLFAEVEAMVARQPPAGVAAASLGMAARPDRSALLPHITVPTLIIAGDSDTLIDPVQSSNMARSIPGSTLMTIPGAGHLANLEEPEKFNAALRAFLGTVK
jgi:pimeloyl-ACP methyl ester carboxylesterase